MNHCRTLAAAATVLAAFAHASRASAQTFEGVVTQPGMRRPIAALPVVLVRMTERDGDDGGRVVDTTSTDVHGRFQLVTPLTGRFSGRIGTNKSGFVFGPVDSVAGDTTIARSYLATMIAEHDSSGGPDSSTTAVTASGDFTLVPPCSGAADGRSGCIVVRFEIDGHGAPKMKTLHVLKFDNAWFLGAVRRHLPRVRVPSSAAPGLGGTAEVEMPFWFSPLGLEPDRKGG